MDRVTEPSRRAASRARIAVARAPLPPHGGALSGTTPQTVYLHSSHALQPWDVWQDHLQIET